MSNSSQILSSSPGHNCWGCHWSSWTDYLPRYLPLAFCTVNSGFPMGHSNDPYLSGSNRLAGHCNNTKLKRIRFTNSRERWSLSLPGEEYNFFLNQSGIMKDNIYISRWIFRNKRNSLIPLASGSLMVFLWWFN